MRIVTYGMGREQVTGLLRSAASPGSTVESCSDYQAAMDVKSGAVDAAIGVCQSGAGGALAIAKALLGAERCAQLSTPSRPPTSEEIEQAVAAGCQVFGIALHHVEATIPPLVAALAGRQA
jgi:hypothetical protein